MMTFLSNWKTIGKLTNWTKRTRTSEMLPNVKSAFHICFASHLPTKKYPTTSPAQIPWVFGPKDWHSFFIQKALEGAKWLCFHVFGSRESISPRVFHLMSAGVLLKDIKRVFVVWNSIMPHLGLLYP